MAKKKGGKSVALNVPIPPIEPMLPAHTAQTPVEGSQDRDSPFDIIPTPMSPSQAPEPEPYGGTYSNPPSRPMTPMAEPEPVPRTRGDSQWAGPGPSSARSRTSFTPRTPRGPSATGDEPRMGDYFTKRRELLDVLKSLHSTG